MKNNKTIIFVLIIIFVLVSSFTISKKYMYPKNDADKVITIGISQMIEHDALDLIYKGITDELNKYYKDSNKK
ncbi:putative ABC transporter substrate binding protein [Brachyspira hyodysenteriae WA1]|nr:ABC transporter substrate-binding protein [Brachyspira hyodysenteriae]ACN82798.1 putative ABC transporter substrate binding protein [Brachyspira hyodysenteriae WA1]